MFFFLNAEENPVPQLITSNTSTISKFWPDAQYLAPSPLATGDVIDVTYVAQEKTLFWLDKSKHIVQLHDAMADEVLKISL